MKLEISDPNEGVRMAGYFTARLHNDEGTLIGEAHAAPELVEDFTDPDEWRESAKVSEAIAEFFELLEEVDHVDE